MAAFDTVIEAIGHTPLVRLRLPPADVLVYAKLELQNLFSMKDRVGRQIVLQARRDGRLKPGDPIVESSSGSMALGLAIVGRALGHDVHIVTDPRIDPITLAKLRALGCAVHVVPAMTGNGWQSARLEAMDRLVRELPNAFTPRQYTNPQNPAAYRTLAAELLADLGRVDVLVGSMGSGGSLCGTALALRRAGQRVRVVGVDCAGSVLFGQPDRPTRLQSGLGNSIHPLNLEHAVVDEVHWLNDREAFAATRDLAAEQQLFAGNTAGSVYRVLGEVAADAPTGATVVGIMPDRGDRYSGTVFDDEYWASKTLEQQQDSAFPKQVAYGTMVSSWSFVRLRPLRGPDQLVFVESNTTGTGAAALGKARDMGLRPVLHTTDPVRYRGVEGSGAEVVRCDTNDPAGLSAQLEGLPLAGLTTTSDYYLQTVAELAERFGLPGNRPEAVARCRDKAATRQALDQSGVPQPGYAVVRAPDEVAAAVAAVGLPCVVKPTDDSGSTNVRCCADLAEAQQQVARILSRAHNDRGQPMAGAALVEEFVPGFELSVETLCCGGTSTLVGITAKQVGHAPYFVETGHAFPAELPGTVADEVVGVVDRALKAVGHEWGPAHTEVRVAPDGRIAVLEINARLAGGMIPELVRLATGIDLVQQQLCLSVGRPVHLEPRLARHAGIRFLTAPRRGVLHAVRGLEEAEAVPNITLVEVTRALGAPVRPPEHALDRLGYLIAAADTSAEVTAALEAAAARIELVLGPAEEGQP